MSVFTDQVQSEMQSPTFPSLRHRPRDSSACQAVSTCQAHKSLIHKRYTRGSQLRAKQARVEQTPPSSAGSGEPANGNSMSAAELRSSQSISSRALGSEDVLDVLLQSAELLLIMGLAGAQGTMLLRVWQQQQQQVEQEHSTDTQKHQVSNHPFAGLSELHTCKSETSARMSCVTTWIGKSCTSLMMRAGDKHGSGALMASARP